MQRSLPGGPASFGGPPNGPPGLDGPFEATQETTNNVVFRQISTSKAGDLQQPRSPIGTAP